MRTHGLADRVRQDGPERRRGEHQRSGASALNKTGMRPPTTAPPTTVESASPIRLNRPRGHR